MSESCHPHSRVQQTGGSPAPHSRVQQTRGSPAPHSRVQQSGGLPAPQACQVGANAHAPAADEGDGEALPEGPRIGAAQHRLCSQDWTSMQQVTRDSTSPREGWGRGAQPLHRKAAAVRTGPIWSGTKIQTSPDCGKVAVAASVQGAEVGPLKGVHGCLASQTCHPCSSARAWACAAARLIGLSQHQHQQSQGELLVAADLAMAPPKSYFPCLCTLRSHSTSTSIH